MSSTDQDIEYLMREIANNNVNMSNLPADSMTQAILERLKEEVAKVYAESGAGDEGEAGSPSRSRVQVRHPMPIDLWKRAHEVEGKPKASVKMTKSDFDAVVARLNESSRRRHASLQEKQRQRDVEELAGHSFKPVISEHSRSIIQRRQDLGAPIQDRMGDLMRLKHIRLEKIKSDMERSEAKELTFKPQLNERPGRGGEEGDGMGGRRTTSHLMQYDIDRRIRAEQRKMLITEIESRDLTFSPAINRNSVRIVERLKQQMESSSSGGGGEAAVGVGGATGRTAPPPAMPHDFMPGHEEEKFKPKILSRSTALANARHARDGGKSVVERLYEVGGGDGSGDSSRHRPRPSTASESAGPLLHAEKVSTYAGVPKPWTEVAYKAETHDFILRRLLRG